MVTFFGREQRMKKLIVLAVFLAVVVPIAGMGEPGTDSLVGGGSHIYPAPEWSWYSCRPRFVETCGKAASEVLEVISSPEKRDKLAHEWLHFSKQSTMLSLETQKEWVQLQRHYLTFQREIEQLRLEKLKFQAEIEKLQLEKLRLEQENLELRLKLLKRTGSEQKTESPAEKSSS
jgi:hypothetical protein